MERAVKVGKRVVTRVNIKTTVPAPSLASDNGQPIYTQHHPRWGRWVVGEVGGGGVFVFLALSEGIGSVNTL